MKKLLALGAFILVGSMVFAQNPSKAKAAPAAAPAHNVATAAPATATATDQDAAVAKKEVKKECNDAEKKQCGTKAAGKKSCCSHAEATKEETK